MAPRASLGWSELELELRRGGPALVAGADEVGRGPLAGPVVACAVVLPPDAAPIAGVRDSKALPATERERLAAEIRRVALHVSVAAASAREIDQLNIHGATVLAIRRAIQRLPAAPDHVLLDGNPLRTLGIPHRAIVKGDATIHAIACASIVAKVVRDRLMRRLALRHPTFGWERNAGYPTPEHLAAVLAAGPTRHHRMTFRGVRRD